MTERTETNNEQTEQSASLDIQTRGKLPQPLVSTGSLALRLPPCPLTLQQVRLLAGERIIQIERLAKINSF